MSLLSDAQLCCSRKIVILKKRISLAFLCIPDCSPLEAIKVASEAKYDALSLRLLPATIGEPNYPLLLDNKLAKKVKEALNNYGVFLSDVEIIRIKANFKVNDFESIIYRCRDLGCKNIITVGDDKEKFRLIENFAKACEMARKYDVTLSIEALPWSEIKCLQDAISILYESKAENAKLVLDALHFYRNKKNNKILHKIPSKLINIFQICDGEKEYENNINVIKDYARTQRLPPGDGELDLDKLIHFINQETIISVEVPNQKMLHKMNPLMRARHLLKCTQNKLYNS